MEEYYGLKQIAYHEEWTFIRDPRVRQNMYLVSTFGRVCNAYSREILKQTIINSGYYTVHLVKSLDRDNSVNRYVGCLVHRLVAEAFIPNDSPYKNTVNHKDSNRLNNYVWNLEWVTQSENNIHAMKYGSMTYGVNNYNAKLNESQVRTVCEMLSKNELYRDIIIAIGLDPKNENNYDIIGNIKRRITYTDISKDYIFPYKTRIKNYSREQIELMCSMIEAGKSKEEIYKELTGEDYINSVVNREFYEFLRRLKARKLCKEISNEYDF